MSFTGWYVSGSTNTPYDFDTLVTDSVTLVAQFNEAQIGFIAYDDGTVSDYADAAKNDGVMPVGVVIEVKSGVATKIVSLQESSKVKMNAGTRNPKATNQVDGKKNRELVEQIQMRWSEYDKFPASEYCDDYVDAASNREWYLPAENELQMVYDGRDKINEALKALGSLAKPLSADFYWSSTQFSDNSTSTWAISFETGESEYHRHGLENLARAIRVL